MPEPVPEPVPDPVPDPVSIFLLIFEPVDEGKFFSEGKETDFAGKVI